MFFLEYLLFSILCFCQTFAWIEPPRNSKVSPPSPGSPWPYPQQITTTGDLMTLDPTNFKFNTEAISCDVIVKAFDRYKDLIFIIGENGKPDPGLRKLLMLEIKVDKYSDKYCSYPSVDQDESYSLDMKYEDQTAHIRSTTVWGALRGLETFSQIIFVNESSKTYCLNVTSIQDSPTFKHRGLMLDTARHFLPIKTIQMNLDAMSYNKLNVFHWHIVDDQSFPIESKMYPNITLLGAYIPRLVYSQDNVKDIVEYARLRGIRVIPEFDTPAHTKAMGKAFPHLLASCDQGSTVLNPTLDNTYQVVLEVIQEWKGLFPDKYLHLGMNDIDINCWAYNHNFQEFMVGKKMKTSSDLLQYYVSTTIKKMYDVNHEYKSVIWQDPLESNIELDKSILVQIRKDTSLDSKMLPWNEYAKLIAKKGYNILVSSGWHLDYISYGQDWKKYYAFDIQGFDDSKGLKKLVMGGEALIFGDLVGATNLLSLAWPRASAVAERLWSSPLINNSDEAQYRLDEQRCRMIRRGIPAEPIAAGFCGDYDWDLEVNYSRIASGKVFHSTYDLNHGNSLKPLLGFIGITSLHILFYN